MKLEKLFAMNVAAELTSAVLGGLTANLPLDPEIKDPAVRSANLMAWETFRVFHHAVTKAFDDDTNWPSPKSTLDVGALASGAAAALLPSGLPGLSTALAPVLSELLAKVTSKPVVPLPGGLIPNPGETAAK